MNNILLGVTGSVAAIKTHKLYDELVSIGDVEIVLTEGGDYFFGQYGDLRNHDLAGDALTSKFWTSLKAGTLPIHRDKDEWPDKFKLGDKILHIELRRWASVLVIAPLDANTLAKIANGICDNLLTCVVRAWDWNRPMILCPAMNTYMWDNSPTKEHLEIMKARGARIIEPVEKRLACNDVGMGAMAPISRIIQIVNNKLRWYFPLEKCSGIPINHHPGAFGFHRRKNHHTGVDLYCDNGSVVHAVEDGVIVKIEQFTGAKVGHEWWNDTWGIMIEGASGVINYGEVENPGQLHSDIKVGASVKRGQIIGKVKQVLFDDKLRPDIPGHSCSMLHFELYKPETRMFADWHDPQKNPDLLDPTPYLMAAERAPRTTWTWDNMEEKTVG